MPLFLCAINSSLTWKRLLCLGNDFQWEHLNKANATEHSVACSVLFFFLNEFMTFLIKNKKKKNENQPSSLLENKNN